MRIETEINNEIVKHKIQVIIAILNILGNKKYEELKLGNLYELPLLKVIVDKIKAKKLVEEESIDEIAVATYLIARYNEGADELLETVYLTCNEYYKAFNEVFGVSLDMFKEEN